MNSNSASAADFMQYNGNGNGSDSDPNSDDVPEYYQPISAFDDDGEDGDINSDQEHHHLPNGYCLNETSYLDLTDGLELKRSDDDEEEEEEERMRQASELAIHRAFIEDENRRNMPLPAENAVRVMEAMRRVSFGGIVPDWAGEVPEDRWIDHLRRLRQPPNNSTSLQS